MIAAKSRPVRIIVALLAAVLWVSPGSGVAAAAPPGLLPLWEVRLPLEDDAHVWVLGSIHLRERGDRRVDARIEEAFRRADTLVVELDPSRRAAEIGLLLGSQGFYADGSTIWDHVPADLEAPLRSALQGLPQGQPLQPTQMKPWLLGLNLTMAGLAACGYTGETGVDALLLARARGDKQIVELETPGEQIGALASLGAQDQVAYLRDTLQHLDSLCAEMPAISEAWAGGDMERLKTLLLDEITADPALAAFHENLFLRRNRAMAEAVQERVLWGGPSLVVIGAGHMLGEEGIPRLLEQQGYLVRQVQRSGAEATLTPSGRDDHPGGSDEVAEFRTDRFSVKMPGTPLEQELPIPGLDTTAVVYVKQGGREETYSVTVIPLPAEPPEAAVPELLDRASQGVSQILGDSAVEEEERGFTSGHPSLRRVVSLPGGVMHLKIVVAGKHLYQIQALHPSAAPSTGPPLMDPSEFVSSFQPL